MTVNESEITTGANDNITNVTVQTDCMAKARAARDPNKKPPGRPTNVKREYDIGEVQELYLDGYTKQEISNITGHTSTTVKRYLESLEGVLEKRRNDQVEEKRARAVQQLRHYQGRAEKEGAIYSPVKAVALAADIEMNIAKLEGLLVDKQDVNVTGSMTLTDLIKAAKSDAGS